MAFSMTHARGPALVSGLVLCSTLSLAAEPGLISSTRITDVLSIDGRLDEPAWAQAKVFDGFAESFPTLGKAPDFVTEARVLHDDTFLYIGVRCADPHPELIVRNLGRRDSTPFADRVEIAIDSSGDHRTAYAFSVNAAGVLRDHLLFADFNDTDTWDAVWNGAASVSRDGWSVEVAIPLRALRFSAQAPHWGFEIRRVVPRTHQVFDSRVIARDANPNNPGALVVSRFGSLDGLTDLKPGQSIEVTAYAAPRLTVRPQYSDPTRPTPRLVDPSLDVGVDFTVALTSKLSLTGTINPDFGQVEADRVIQNLSTAEPFFPEKRPFFLQGLDLFQPVGAEYGSPQQQFYSRRIGLRAPILAAVKLTGSLTETLDIGLLDSIVLGAGNPSLRAIALGPSTQSDLDAAEAQPDRRFQWHPQTPLHFGLNDELPFAPPVTTNYLAAVVRQRFNDHSSVGAMLTAATPLAARCSREEFATEEDYRQAHCQAGGVNALGLDFNLRTHDGVWGVFGQLTGSQQVLGDAEGRMQSDGVVLKPGDLGVGGNLRAGKLGGEPFRFDVTYVYESPKLDLNAMGFQPLSNYQWADLNLHYVRPNGMGPLHSFSLDYNLDLNWSADARLLPRGLNSNINAELQLPSFDWVGARLGLEMPQFDTREISEAGVAFERQPDLFLAVYGNTDNNRKLSVSGDLFGYRLFATGAEQANWGWGTDVSVTWHPLDALETRLDASFGHKPQGARWVDTVDGHAIFGDQDPMFLSVTLRQQMVITPRLTFQVYAQLFSGAVRYNSFYAAPLADRTEIAAVALTPATYAGNPNGHAAALNLNAVLRWEYRLGSTIYFVYSHAQHERALGSGEVAPTGVFPSQLFSGPGTDTFLVKWTYWFAV
jgi:Domain of unknown function (DUF5916)/Carbohydrate family 9 binding domain-like